MKVNRNIIIAIRYEVVQKEMFVILNEVKNLITKSKSEILRSLRSLRMTFCVLFGQPHGIASPVQLVKNSVRMANIKVIWFIFLIFVTNAYAQNQKLSLYLEEGKSGTVWDVALSKDGSRIYSCGRDSTAKVWNAMTGEAMRMYRVPNATLNTCLTLSPDDKYLLIGDMNNKVHIWNAANGDLVRSIENKEGYLLDLQCLPDGKGFVHAGRDGIVYIKDFEGKEIQKFDAKSIWINAIAISHAQDIIATAGQDGSVKIWDLNSGNLKYHLGNHSRFARTVCFSNDDAYLISGGRDGFMKVWDVSSGKLIRTMKMTNGFPHHLAMSADGNTLIASSMNYLIEAWDWKRGLLIREFEARSYGAMTAVLNASATRLYSAHTDGSVKIWSYPNAVLIAQMVGFSDGQWITFTQDGFFDCSSQGARYAQWKQDENFYPFDLYDEMYHKPSIIEDALSGKYSAVSSLSRVVEPPTAKITSPREKQLFSFGTEPLQLIVQAEYSDKTSIESDEIIVNGRLVSKDQLLEKKITENNPTSRKVEYKVQVLPGQNVIEAVAYNDSRIRSDPARVVVNVETQLVLQPNLFVVTVGIDNYAPAFPDLQYASIDAGKLAEVLSQQEGKLFTRVYTTKILNKEATRENILKSLERFPKMTSNDMLLLFFSGHGIRARNQKGDTKYYYVSAGATKENIIQRGLGWDDFASQVSKVGAGRILLFLDACHSGDVSNSASNEKVAALLSRQIGIVFASSSGNEYSFENADWKHGAFTEAILEALSGEADYTKDDKIDWSELQLFVINKVRELTKGSQNPMIPRLEQFSNFDLVRLK